MKLKYRRGFVDELIVFAFAILIVVALLRWAGIMQTGALYLDLGLIGFSLLVIIIFRGRIKRKISESLR